MGVGGASPDPLMAVLRTPARRLLERAYAKPGAWHGTSLRNPSFRHVGWAARIGLDPLLSPDPVPSGTARTRWMRGFVRTLNYEHKWYSEAPGGGWRADRRTRARGGLKWQVGRSVPFRGRAIRVRVETGAEHYVRRKMAPDDRYVENEEIRAGVDKWRDW